MWKVKLAKGCVGSAGMRTVQTSPTGGQAFWLRDLLRGRGQGRGAGLAPRIVPQAQRALWVNLNVPNSSANCSLEDSAAAGSLGCLQTLHDFRCTWPTLQRVLCGDCAGVARVPWRAPPGQCPRPSLQKAQCTQRLRPLCVQSVLWSARRECSG